LVGLELRPRRARDAATLWATIARERGTAARDEFWAHPDVIPSPEDLDSPTEFLARREASAAEESEIDAALAAMLDGTLGTEEDVADSGGPADSEGPSGSAGPEGPSSPTDPRDDDRS